MKFDIDKVPEWARFGAVIWGIIAFVAGGFYVSHHVFGDVDYFPIAVMSTILIASIAATVYGLAKAVKWG